MYRIDTAENMRQFLDKITRLGLNTPELIISAPLMYDDDWGKTNLMIIHTIGAVRNNKVKTVLKYKAAQDIQYLSPIELQEMIDGFNSKTSFLLFKAPSGKTVYNGHCNISPLYNYVSLYELSGNPISEHKIAWGDSIDEVEDKNLRIFLHELCYVLSQRRSELDGAKIRFCYCTRMNGILNQKLMFWGM